jgi:signal transduction histidine kinase
MTQGSSPTGGVIVRGGGLRVSWAWPLLTVAGLLPILLLGLVAYQVTSDSVRALVQANNRSTAQLAAELVGNDMASSIEIANSLAMSPGLAEAVRNRDEAAIRLRFEAAQRACRRLDRLMLVDPQGVLWADYPVNPEIHEKSVAQRDYFQGVSRDWSPFVSEVYLRWAKPRRPVVAVAVPIRDSEEKVIGILGFQYRLEELTHWVEDLKLGANGYVFLLDHRGNVAGHPKLDLQSREYADYADVAPVKAALDGKESTVEYVDPLAGRAMVATFMPVPVSKQHWVVVAQLPVDEARAPIRRLGMQLLAATAALALVALIVVLSLGQIRRRLRLANQSLRQLLEVYERHRQLVAYEIHDGLAQRLAAAMMSFEGLQSACGNGSPSIQVQFEAAMRLLREGLAEARRLMSGLRPMLLDDFGVLEAVKQLVKESQLATGVDIRWTHRVTFQRLAPPLETAVYRIIQEGLNNALHHSRSDEVLVELIQEGQRLRITVEDQGMGFDPEKVDPSRFGLRGLRERAQLFGGHAAIDSSPGRGTRVAVELPVVESAEEDRDPPADSAAQR